MGEHYFSETPSSAHEVHTFSIPYRGKAVTFETDAGVFSKGHLDTGTAMLLEVLPEAFAGRMLDLGCGWGAVGVCAASAWKDAKIALTDINERAVALAKANLARNGLTATVAQGDGLASVEGMFDLIALNPPIRAGKAVIYRLFEEAAERLCPVGSLYIVIRKQQGADSAAKFLKGLFPRVEIVSRGGGGFRVIRGTLASAGS